MNKNREKKPANSIAKFSMANLSINTIYGIEKYTKDEVSVLIITFTQEQSRGKKLYSLWKFAYEYFWNVSSTSLIVSGQNFSTHERKGNSEPKFHISELVPWIWNRCGRGGSSKNGCDVQRWYISTKHKIFLLEQWFLNFSVNYGHQGTF